jgi:hypothetical protein
LFSCQEAVTVEQKPNLELHASSSETKKT